MNLSRDWTYIREIAKQRLQSNITDKHVHSYGTRKEIMGAAGELAARRLLGLGEKLHTGFDNGADLYYKGWTVDVKSTEATQAIDWFNLQIPYNKILTADIILLIAIDMTRRNAIPVGWTTSTEILSAKINKKRPIPCHEIPMKSLSPTWRMFIIEPSSRIRNRKEYLAKIRSFGYGTEGTESAYAQRDLGHVGAD